LPDLISGVLLCVPYNTKSTAGNNGLVMQWQQWCVGWHKWYGPGYECKKYYYYGQ